MRVVEQVLIERPAEDVWSVIADLDSHPAWRPSLVEFRQVSDGPLDVGSRIREVLLWRGRELILDDVVTAFDPPSHLGIRGGWKSADFELDLTLEPAGDDATLVTFEWPLYPKSLLLRIASPFLKGAMKRATVEELELLRARVEALAVRPG